jgi:hypothetical protein
LNRSTIRLAAIVLAAAVAGALIMLAIIRPRAKEADAPAEAKAPQRVSIENGEPTITLDAATQQKIGLVTTPTRASQQNEELQLFGNVVDVQELAAIENQAATARAQAAQARAKAAYDRNELARLKTLNADNRAVSDRVVQEAAATLAADEAAAASATASMQAAASTATQRFGPLIASALASRSALYENLISMRQVLIQIAQPLGNPPPQMLTTVGSDGRSIPARLLSPAPRVDPKLQGASYFYVAPRGNLAAGMNVTARYAGARATAGVIVPSDAAVSFQGKSWIYIRRDPTRFARREISTATPVPGGFFVTNIKPGSDVVTTGAQQLLSEEMRAQLREE